MSLFTKHTVTPTIDDDAYSDGDAVGEVMEFTNVASVYASEGVIKRITILDINGDKNDPKLVLFQSEPDYADAEDPGHFADDDPFAPDADDLARIFAIVDTSAGTWVDGDGAAVMLLSDLEIPFILTSGETSLFGQLIDDGGDTYSSTDGVTVELVIARR
jgi:hypothetical protein